MVGCRVVFTSYDLGNLLQVPNVVHARVQKEGRTVHIEEGDQSDYGGGAHSRKAARGRCSLVGGVVTAVATRRVGARTRCGGPGFGVRKG